MKPEQPPKLIIEERDQYLFVEYGGNPLTLQMLVEMVNKVAETLRRRQYDRVLILRDAPLLETDSNRQLVSSLVGGAVNGPVCFAIVDVYGNDPVQTRRAVEASRLAGWNLNYFDTEDEAIAWLLHCPAN